MLDEKLMFVVCPYATVPLRLHVHNTRDEEVFKREPPDDGGLRVDESDPGALEVVFS